MEPARPPCAALPAPRGPPPPRPDARGPRPWARGGPREGTPRHVITPAPSPRGYTLRSRKGLRFSPKRTEDGDSGPPGLGVTGISLPSGLRPRTDLDSVPHREEVSVEKG